MLDEPNQEDSLAVSENVAVDLSELQSLNFGPNWGNQQSKPSLKQSRNNSSTKQDSSKQGQRKDRRPKRKNLSRPQIPQLINKLEINIFPEDEPFKKLCKAIRRSYVTYELFEIAQAILEKEDRFIILIKSKNQEPQEDKNFYLSVPDKIPFMTEAEALSWFYKNHMDKYFDIEEVEQEQPKGTFTSVTRCKTTGEIIGPPNYHRYQQLLQEHHATHLSHVPFNKFTNNLETDKSEEAINEWLQKMTKAKQYKLKAETNEESQTFDSLESAKHYLLTKHSNKILKTVDSIRLPGSLLEKMANSPFKQAIQYYIQQQQKFPLDTANNIRGRLRRMQFTIYKKGSKGVSYVCATKRRFRNDQTPLAESITELINFIDANPLINIGDLRTKLIKTEEPESSQEEQTANDATASSTENKALTQLNTDLKWLLAEGFVIQYSDGRLFANPVMNEQPSEQSANETQPEPLDTPAHEEANTEQTTAEPQTETSGAKASNS